MKICPRCMRQFEDAVEDCPDDGTRLRTFRDQTSQLVGTVLDGRWRIEEKIGEGGMGEVYRARQVNVDRVVAVKVLRLALASTEQYVARFFREADIATTVKHPHFVTIYDFGQTQEDQLLYIAMELLDGESLATILKQRRLDLLETLTIAAQVCAALAAAHGARIVHRDLKPDNIFLIHVAEGGTFAKVLDFGIAKDLDSDNQVTRTGQLFGTPEYMSPEQCEGGERVDGRSDLYAVGCILYEALVGRSPFQRDSIIQTLMSQVRDDPTPFSELGIPVPVGVADIVYRLLEKHPDNRFSDAIEARNALMHEVERLRSNSGEMHVYETVSSSIKPRGDSAQTVSYSDLAHPLQLEGVLANSARSAIDNEAKRRQARDADRSTEVDVIVGGDSRRAWLLPIVAVLLLGGAAAGYLLNAEEPPDPPPPPRALVVPEVSAKIHKGVQVGARESTEQATESEARRWGSGVAQTAVAAALGKPEEVKKSRSGGNNIRTQSSMSARVMRQQGPLMDCYNARTDKGAGGSVDFVFDIAVDGTVNHYNVKSPNLAAEVIACMKNAAGKVRFRSSVRSARFVKTLVFRPQ